MPRPKRLRKSKNCSPVSTYPHHIDGFNECKKLYDKHIPNVKEWEFILLNNQLKDYKNIAKIVSERLQ